MRGWSRRELIGRLALIGGLAAALLLVARLSFAAVLASGRPDAAMRLSPHNVQAQAAQARALIQGGRFAKERSQVDALVAGALRRDPSSVDAVAAAGLARDLAGRSAEARRLFAYGETLSRRDLATQLWLIESAVARADVAGALRHYDVALRTSRGSSALLFPVLVAAVSGPAIIEPLAKVLAAQPQWSTQFMQQLAQSGTDLPSAAALYRAIRARGAPVPEQTVATLAARLVEARDYPRAWSLYANFHPGARPDSLRNGRLRDRIAFPSPFDWTLSDEPALGVQQVTDGGGGVITFDAASDASGVGARQLLLLAPGRHVLTGRAYDTAEGGARLPTFRLRCAEVIGAETLGQVELPRAGADGARFQAAFTVPAGCRAQWLELAIAPSEEAMHVAGSVGELTLR